jgi:phosphotransferase system HPr (HPr) family protein
MKKISFKITDPIWMHLGTASSFIGKMQNFSSIITVSRGKESGNGKEFYGVMKLKPLKGDITTIKADGSDEEVVIKAVIEFFKENIDSIIQN